MMNYIVASDFVDLKDGYHHYSAGDVYPRTGYTPSQQRIAELSSTQNKARKPLIIVEVNPEPKTEAPKPKTTKKRTSTKQG